MYAGEGALLHAEVADTDRFDFAGLVHLLHVCPGLVECRLVDDDEVSAIGFAIRAWVAWVRLVVDIGVCLRPVHEPLHVQFQAADSG